MRLRKRRNRLEQLLKDAGDAPAALGSALADVRVRPPKAVASGLAAVVAVTAGSAGVSALRRRGEARSDR